MTNFEKILLRQNAINHQLNLIIMQQNTGYDFSIVAALNALQWLVQKLEPGHQLQLLLSQELEAHSTRRDEVTLALKSLFSEIKQLNMFIEAMDDHPDMDAFKFSWN